MKIEVFSQSKDKSGRRDGDDIAVCLPGRLYAVFDGATDALGTRVGGESVGRIAARTVADVITAVALDPGRAAQDGAIILADAAAALGAVNAALGLPIPASTTVAAVFETADAFRVLVLGDSAVRVNGSEIMTRSKIIDDVSASARIAVFKRLATRISDPDDLEYAARSVILLGFSHAVADGMLTRAEAENVIENTVAAPQFVGLEADIRAFLTAGIRHQFTYANNAVSPLGYASMNGTPIDLRTVIDRTLHKADVRTLELYTDGYFGVPTGTTLVDWEKDFIRIEAEDRHKIDRYPAVKGTTSSDFSDDRTVMSLTFGKLPAPSNARADR